MFAPFDETLALDVLGSIVDALKNKTLSLVRQARPSDQRDTSLVMLGVLVCRDKAGNLKNLITLSGISCFFKGELCGTFVEPLVSQNDILQALEKNDLLIHQLTDEILRLEAEKNTTEKIRELKRQRTELCDESLLNVFKKYFFCCADGKKRSLLEILDYEKTKKLPPTGTGDCCAPKLLSYAFENALTPLSMAETKIHFEINESSSVSDCSGAARRCFMADAMRLTENIEALNARNHEKRDGTECRNAQTTKLKLYPPCDARCSLILPQILGLKIIYRDSDIIVVNKQSGLLSVPGRGPEKQDCVVNRVKTLFPDCIEQPSVHRLDMETSGLLVLAFTKEAHRELNRQFEQKEVFKKYVALVDGILAKKGIEPEGTMELFFRVDIENRPHQIWDEVYGKNAVTQWQIKNVEYYTAPDKSKRAVTRVIFIPHTGRTHQLRLAASDVHGFGVPIVGDSLYGKCEKGERLLLHAFELEFTHPRTKQRMHFVCPPEF